MINEFRGENYFLSNFFNAPVMYQGLMYKNNEAAFQSAKVLDIETRKQFCNLDPSSAKRKGRQVKLRKDWEDVKVSIMEEIVRDKFTRNEELAQKLIKTGNLKLIEGNTWNDKYWGVCNGYGLNVLGAILMKVRSELQDLT